MISQVAASGPWALRLDRAARMVVLPLSHPAAEALAIVTLIPLTLAVALWNGFPIIFYDTGAYLLEGSGHAFLAERSPVYSLLLDYGGGVTSLWLIALIQAVATAFVSVGTGRIIAPRLGLGAFLAIMTGLVLLTGLPWYVGQIEPDCFAAVAVLSLYLLMFHRYALGLWRALLLMAAATLSLAVHPSHLLLGGFLGAIAIACRTIAFLKKTNIRFRPKILEPLLCCVFGLSLIVAGNFKLTGEVFVSRAGPAFVFARMLQDGIVMRLLDDTCPESHYRLCAYKDVLPRTADQWLWGRGSPFLEMGRFTGTRAESSRIIWDSLKRYPLQQAEWALTDWWRQFTRFGTGDQIEPQQWILSRPMAQIVPRQMQAYLSARQQEGLIDFQTINRIHLAAAWLSLIVLCLTFAYSLRRRFGTAAVFLGFILLALAGNAAICGTLSNPHDRYQSRLIWLAPFALALMAVDWPNIALRGMGESGT